MIKEERDVEESQGCIKNSNTSNYDHELEVRIDVKVVAGFDHRQKLFTIYFQP